MCNCCIFRRPFDDIEQYTFGIGDTTKPFIIRGDDGNFYILNVSSNTKNNNYLEEKTKKQLNNV